MLVPESDILTRLKVFTFSFSYIMAEADRTCGIDWKVKKLCHSHPMHLACYVKHDVIPKTGRT